MLSRSVNQLVFQSVQFSLYFTVLLVVTLSALLEVKGKTAWSVWKTFPQLTDALKALTANPKAFQEREVMAAIERFVILLYDRTSLQDSVNDSRHKLFSHKAGLENIPPTLDALTQHLRRSIYQGYMTVYKIENITFVRVSWCGVEC